MFCKNCGNEIENDAKFCKYCGEKIVLTSPKKEIDGKVFKCPSCGEVLPFDAIRCPSCNWELREKEVSKSIAEFVESLRKTQNIKEKIDVISLWPIPNTREDVIEFMNISTSNFIGKDYLNENSKNHFLACAWHVKIEQCYKKAMQLLKDENDIKLIKVEYKKMQSLITNEKRNNILNILMMVSFPVLVILGFIIRTVTMPKDGEHDDKFTLIFYAIMWVMFISGLVLFIIGLVRHSKNIKNEKN